MSPERLNILVVSPRRTASSGCRSRCHRCSGPWTGSCARGGSTSSTWSFGSLATAIYARLHPARGARPLEAAVRLHGLTGDKSYKGIGRFRRTDREPMTKQGMSTGLSSHRVAWEVIMSGQRLSVLVVAANASTRWAGEAILPLHIFRGLRKAGHDAWMCVGNETKPE